MTIPTEPHVVTLRDSPASTDFFGGHERVAQALHSLIVTEPHGLTVGLEGPWGSGKSTVVTLLREKLKNSDIHTFVYDTWAHEGDPLRRSFLESLIDDLLQQHWLRDEQRWRKQLKVLANRYRETEQITTTTLSSFGTGLAIATTLVPFGLLLMSTGISRSKVWLQFVGGGLALSPLLVAVYFWAKPSLSRRISKDRKTAKGAGRLGIFKQQTETTQTTTTETPDPTSIEFQTMFTTAVDEALSPEGRRLLIVLDNLDRVRPSTAEQVLATLQPFIEDQDRSLKLPQLWILVPYDRAALCGIARRFDSDSTGTSGDHLPDKLFDVRYDTPPLAQSDWRSFMNDCLRQAFPGVDVIDLNHVTAVVAAARLDQHPTQLGDHAGATSPPTPRQIIQIVNRIGGAYRQWNTAIPLGDLGYFAYLRYKNAAVDVELIGGTLPGKSAGRLLGSSVEDSMVMLHFNVELEQARQLLLLEPIRTALLDGNDEKVYEMSQLSGFWEVVETLPFHGWAERSSNDLGQAGATLARAGVLSNAPRSTLDQIAAALTLGETWALSGREPGMGLGALARSALRESSDFRKFARSLELNEGNGMERDALADGIQAAVAFAEVLVEDHPRGLKTKDVAITVRGSALFHIVACDLLALEDPEGRFWSVFRATATGKKLAEVLTTAEPGADGFDSKRAIPVLATQSRQPDWTQVAAEMSTRISQASEYDADLGVAIQALTTLSSLGLTDPTDLVDDGHVMKVFEFAARNADHDVAVEAAFLQLTWHAALHDLIDTVGQTGKDRLVVILSNTDVNPEVSERLGERILENSPATHLEIIDELGATPWSARWVAELANREGGVDANQLVTHWKSLAAALDADELAKLIIHRASDGTLASAIDPSADEPAPPGMLRTVLQAIDTSETVSKNAKWNIRDNVVSRLRGLERDEWYSELSEDGEWLAVVGALPEKLLRLGEAYKEALLRHSVALARGDEQLTDDEEWKTVLAALDPQLTGPLGTSILRALNRLDKAIAHDFWDVYGLFLANEPEVHQEPSLFDIVQEAVRRTDLATLRWASDMFDSNPEILAFKKHGSRVKSLRSLVAEWLSSDSADELVQLARVLKLESQRDQD